ncbi:MAG: methionyl-tRNA formyltransferase, partial [Gammaproteobacteria bacterium]|nr:methionyl-tRNA formyltransferase [Gammaproteobacteria bacterium]
MEEAAGRRSGAVRVLFWGTATFALPSLRSLADAGHEIAGVVTQPDRRAGRGRRPRPTPVGEAALAAEYKVFTPERPGRPAFLARMRALRPDLSVVAAYGHFLSREALELPALGSINVHASLLPELRGAAPVQWAIARGHPVTGVTIMRMVKAMDAGPILRQDRTDILPDETASELYERLARAGGRGLVRALEMMDAGTLEEHPQDHARATFAPRVFRRDARVDWARPAVEVARWMRAMDAVPGAWSELDGSPLKLFRPRLLVDDVSAKSHGPKPGTVIAADPGEGFRVAAGEGSVELGEVQPAGKRRMP